MNHLPWADERRVCRQNDCGFKLKLKRYCKQLVEMSSANAVNSYEDDDDREMNRDLVVLEREIQETDSQNKKLSLVLIVIIAAGLYCFYSADPEQTVCKYDTNIEIPKASRELDHGPAPHHHDMVDATFPYPTVGIPTPGNKFNFTLVPEEKMKEFDNVFLEIFEPYIDTDCDYVRYGMPNEGGYVLCKNYFENSQALINIGIEGRDSLGCDLTAEHRMPNYQYDCTDPKAPKCDKNGGSDRFYHQCVGEKTETDGKFTYITLEDMVKRHNLTGKHWSLKIDIEGAENQAFKYFPVKDLEYIDVIVMEIHMGFIYPEEWGMLDVYRTLTEHFAVVNIHENNIVCYKSIEPWNTKRDRRLKTPALETTLINRKLINIKSQKRSYAWHALNTRDEPNALICP